jgi:hypothetical protein
METLGWSRASESGRRARGWGPRVGRGVEEGATVRRGRGTYIIQNLKILLSIVARFL